jgi:NAD(P)-dependent dehydrogenase (short-subunit alcohol dehydrogenase family)
MKISGSTVLVTGANRGLGYAFVRALAAAGCAKIYAAARNIATRAADERRTRGARRGALQRR